MTLRDDALKLHLENHGKLAVVSKVPIKTREDLALAYTPGVAEPCKEIKENKDLSFEYTCRGNMVAIVSDGTRVLGLGDIGPEAAMPVMEGKAALFKTFGDVDAVPICIDTKDPAKIIETVRFLQPSFAVNNKFSCFHIFFHETQSTDNCCQTGNCSTVLIVMENS